MSQGQIGMGVYLVEGIVEQDPMSDRFVIRTVDQEGKPITFDPQAVLGQLKGQEIRIVVAPLATVQEVERLVRQQQAEGHNVQAGEPGPAAGGQVSLTASLSGGKGRMKA